MSGTTAGRPSRKADATTAGKEANGFVLSAVTLGNNATVYFDGTDTQLSSLTPGRSIISRPPQGESRTPRLPGPETYSSGGKGFVGYRADL